MSPFYLYQFNLTVILNLFLCEVIGRVFLVVGYDTAVKCVFQHMTYYGFIPPCFTHCSFSALTLKLFLYFGKSVARKIHIIYESDRFRLLRVD